MSGGKIHGEHPFAVPGDRREPARRLRGRLAAPVTVLTASGAAGPVGMTVSSITLAEGEPPVVSALVGDVTDFAFAVEESAGFVVHVLEASMRERADVFAGIRPAPGGMFRGVDITDTTWGPRMTDVTTWAGCRVIDTRPLGYLLQVVGAIEAVEVGEETDPLVWYRGAYRRLD